MNEFSNQKHLKPIESFAATLQDDAAASLAGLVNLTNAAFFAESGCPVAPPEVIYRAVAPATIEQINPQPLQVLTRDVVNPTPESPPNLSRVFYTGRFKTGKDFVAAQTSAKIFSLAEPLYAVQKYFFGDQDKDAFGAREFLQRVGQWGRGEVSEKYPLTTERAAFVALARSLECQSNFPDDGHVDWQLFGLDKDIWMRAMLSRVEDYLKTNPGARVAVTNVRFENEHSALIAEGWTGYHVMASSKTWVSRLRAAGLKPDGAEAVDASERLASGLDADVSKRVSTKPAGSKLRVIWSDESAALPSRRLYLVSEYVALFKQKSL